MTSSDPLRRTAWGLLLLAALALRVAWPGAVPFRLDEAITLAFGQKIATGRDWPARGLRTSFGWHNPPTMFYLTAMPSLASRDPRVATVLLALAGTSAVVAVGGAAARLAGPGAALPAAALIAFSPNAIEHARRLWGHDLMVPLAAWVLWCVGRAGPSRAHLVAGALLAALAQTLHLSGALLWLPWLMALRFVAPRERLLALGAGGAAVVLLYAPWVVAEAREGWPDVAIAGAVLKAGPSLAEPHAVAPGAAWAFVLGDGLHTDFARHPRPFDLSPALSFFSPATNLLAVVLLGAGLVAAVLFPQREALPAVVLLLAPLVAFGILMQAAVPPYLLPALPAAAVLAGAALARAGPRTMLAGCAIWAFVGAGNAMALRTEVRRHPERYAPTVEGLAAVVDAVAAARRNERLSVRQDLRSRAAGPDAALVYAWFWRTGESRFPIDETPGLPLLVIRDPEVPLPPRLDLFLLRQPAIAAGGRRLIRIEGEAADVWRALADSGGVPPR